MFGSVFPVNLIELDLRNLFRAVFDEKILTLKKLARNFDKTTKKIFVFTNKNQQHFLKELTNFRKIGEVLAKNSEKCE